MKTLLQPFFLICCALWILNQLLEQNKIFVLPLFSYLDDLLCLPLTLYFILAVQRLYFRNQGIIIPISHILFAIAAFTVYFELVLPAFSKTYTADVLDVVAYSIGALAFHIIGNKPLTVKNQ
jgi:hypothetical protein